MTPEEEVLCLWETRHVAYTGRDESRIYYSLILFELLEHLAHSLMATGYFPTNS